MAEIKSDEKRPPIAADQAPPPSSAPEAENVPAAAPVAEKIEAEKKPAGAGEKPLTLQLPQPRPPAAKSRAWLIALIASALLVILVLFALVPHNRPKAVSVEPFADPDAANKSADLSHYSAFLAKNRALGETYSERILTDEPFVGQAPLACAANGPVVSADLDPQLAALAEALKIRVQLMNGSETIVRGNAATRSTRGGFRGFKVQAVEKLENGKIVSEEVSVLTPKNGAIQTVGRVLTSLQKTDAESLLAEIRAAGMEYSPLADKTSCRLRLRLLREWKEPVAEDRLISGESVGRVSVGMPLSELPGRIGATDSILKRKVLINDVYHEVYKVMDQRGDPLFFVYEREGRVRGIWVVGGAFKTDKGVGVDNSLDQLRIHYPAVTLVRAEKNPLFARVEGVAGMWILQEEKEKRAIAVLIGDSPEFD